jgi:stage V sporulation protein R
MNTAIDERVARKRLPSPSDWTFDLIELYFNEIRRTAQSFGLDT